MPDRICAECRVRNGHAPICSMSRTAQSTVAKLELVEVGEGFRFDPDAILEAAKGRGFTILLVAGQLPNGEIWLSGSANAGETLILLEQAKHQTIFGK